MCYLMRLILKQSISKIIGEIRFFIRMHTAVVPEDYHKKMTEFIHGLGERKSFEDPKARQRGNDK